jgi:hypothetical protein
MFIKSFIAGADRIIHSGVVYKVVKGIADVPEDVAEELTKFAHWADATEPVPEDVQAELAQGFTDGDTEEPAKKKGK